MLTETNMPRPWRSSLTWCSTVQHICLLGMLLPLLANSAPVVLSFGDIRIHLCSEDTVRITAASSDSLERAKLSKAVVNRWSTPPEYTVHTVDEHLTRIATTRMMIVLQGAGPHSPSSPSITFYRRSLGGLWERMLTDINRTSEPVRDTDGSMAHRVSAQWKFETAREALYGGGSHQQGLINYRGARVAGPRHADLHSARPNSLITIMGI